MLFNHEHFYKMQEMNFIRWDSLSETPRPPGQERGGKLLGPIETNHLNQGSRAYGPWT